MSHDEQPDAPLHGECAAEIHRLQARVAELELFTEKVKSDSLRVMATLNQAEADRDAALARIAELEKQEPVAQFNWNAAKFEWLTKYDYHKHHLKPLYLASGASPQPSQAPQGCACRWDAEDNRIATCTRHQGWLDVVQEWADRAKAAESKLAQPSQAPELSELEILHLVDTHVGCPTPSYPLENNDWINFARAVIAAINAKESK